MDDKTKSEIVSIFNERILSPVLYMVEYDDIVDLICFCDRNIIIGEIYDTAAALQSATGKHFEIVDMLVDLQQVILPVADEHGTKQRLVLKTV